MRRLSLSPGWVRGLLLASLCLNVLLGAFIATRWVEGRAPIFTAAPPQLVEIVARRLPAADAEIVRRIYRSKEAQFAAAQADYVRALRVAGRLMAESRIDAAAVRAAVIEARDSRIKVGDLAIDTFLEALPQVSVEGRRSLLARMRVR